MNYLLHAHLRGLATAIHKTSRLDRTYGMPGVQKKGGFFPALLARMFHQPLTATTDMAVLPCVLGCRPLRRTI